MSESEKPPAADPVVSPPVDVSQTVPDSALQSQAASSPATDEGLPDWEPLTPELVEDEAIRGDFMLRWAVVLLALLIGCRQIVETTTLVHVKTGQYLASHGFWPPANDVFSATASDRRWVNLSWLWDLIAAGLFSIGEGIGLSLATAMLVAATWWLIGKTTRAGVSTWFGSILGVLTLLACHPHFSGQPETITLFGLAASLWWLHVWQSSTAMPQSASVVATIGQPVSLWWLMPGFFVWSNLDNRAFLGLTLLLLWGIGDIVAHQFNRASLTAGQRSHFWRVLGTCLVATCLTPFAEQSLISPIALYGTEYPAWHFYASPSSGPDEAGVFSLFNLGLWKSGSGRLPLLAGIVVLVSALVSIGLNARRAKLGDVLAFSGFVALAGIASHELAAASIVACVIATLNAQQWYQSNFRQGYSIETRELLFTRGGRAITVMAFFLLAVTSVNQSLFGRDGKRVGLGLSNRLRAMIDSYREATASSFDDRPFNFVPQQGDVLVWIDQKPFLDSRLGLYARRAKLDLLALHDQARHSLASSSNSANASISAPADPGSAGQKSDWRIVFDHFHLTHAMPRLFGGNPTAYFRMLANPDWRLTQLSSHCAVFYRQDEVSLDLTQFLEKHLLALRKLAFQTTEPAAMRMDWPRTISSFQKFFRPPESHVSNKVLEAENLLLHLRAITLGHLTIDQPTAVGMAHLAIRKANAGLAESADNALAYQALGEAYSFLLTVETSIEQSHGVPFENRLRFNQALGAYYQAILLEPKSLVLRDRLLDLLQRHKRFDLVLRELEIIDRLTPLTGTDDLEESDILQRRLLLREQCESQQSALHDQIDPLLEKGQNAAALAPQVYASGFVLEALRLLSLDPADVNESPELQVLQSLLRFESGEIEEAYRFFEFESENNPSSWRVPAAWTRLAHGEYDKAIELWTSQTALRQRSAVTGVLVSMPMLQSPYHMLGHPNVWPSHHSMLLDNAQLVEANESSSLLWYTAMCQIEAGNPQVAGKTLAGLLELNPETPLRPLIRFYLFAITDELVDPEPPSQWIPIDSEMFVPDEPADTGTN